MFLRIGDFDADGVFAGNGCKNVDAFRAGRARKIAFERRMREQVESIVTSVVGPGRARVQLTADFDFNRITQTFDKFDPDSRVVRSSQTREEMSGAAADGNAGAVSVGNELPGANRPADAAAAARPMNIIESGPAGGVVGGQALARARGGRKNAAGSLKCGFNYR